MRLLLDTHALLWWVTSNRRLSRRAARAIDDQRNTVVVSAASAFEIATKARLGRLDFPKSAATNLAAAISDDRFETLAITYDHAQRAGNLPGDHADPFDRLLAAQAQLENLRLVSNDEALDALGAERYW